MQRKLPNIILTVTLAFVFGVFGVDKLLNPLIWIGWMPVWMDGLMGVSVDTWLTVISIVEMGLALLLLIPVRQVRIAGCILIILHLLGILTQVGWNDIAVRDIGLLGAALALLTML